MLSGLYCWQRRLAMDLREVLGAMTPEEQTEWLKAHMPDWDCFVEGIRISREEIAAHEASGAPGYPHGWISLDEYRDQLEHSSHAESQHSVWRNQ
jgi:hypothetical protein